MEFSNSSHDATGKGREDTWQLSSDLDDNASPNSNVLRQILQQTSQQLENKDIEEHDYNDDSHQDLDPAWGIKHSDTAHLLDTVRRTSSFPALQYDFSGPPSIPHEEEQQQAFNAERVAGQAMYRDDNEGREITSNAFDASERTQQDAVSHVEDPVTREESRFEEGLPLISNDFTAKQEIISAEPMLEDNVVHDRKEAPEQVQEASRSAQFIPELERKDTQDVIHGLDVDQNVPDSPTPPDEKSEYTLVGKDNKESALAAAFAEIADDEDDPWKAAMGDDDEFLVEDADDILPDSDEETELPPAINYAQQRQNRGSHTLQRQTSNPYAPHQPTTSELSQFGINTSTHQVGLPRQIGSSAIVNQTLVPQPNITNRAESYVDQSKGGYKSPYDLPLDLAPKRKAQNPRAQPTVNSVPPPPRSSSLSSDKQLQSPFSPTAPAFREAATSSPNLQSAAVPNNRSASVPVKAAPTSNKRASGFFEELPITAKARPSFNPSRAAAQTPQGPPRSAPGLTAPPAANFPQPPQVVQQEVPSQQDPHAQYQLRAPEKLDPYSNVALQPVQTPSVQPLSSRYSPAPPAAQNGIKPSPSPRYSPAPPMQPTTTHNRYVSQPAPPNLPFQPRTSSPLAQHRRSVDEATEQKQIPNAPLYHTASSSVPYASTFSPPAAQTLSPPQAGDPVKKYEVVPPRRSQTQSPSRQMQKPGIATRMAPPPNRPASAFGQLSPVRTAAVPNVLSPPRVRPVARSVEQVDYVKPHDETQHDPLERWKGAPIFVFGFGGNVVTSFPQRIPRFSSTAARPQMKVSPGLVKIQTMASLVDVQDTVVKFPGPLRLKSKKKDVIGWLSTSIALFEATAMSSPSKQLDEKVLLWKVVRVLVEQDGNIESPQAVQTISALLMPGVYGSDESIAPHLQAENNLNGIYRPAATVARSETVDPAAIESLRKMLLTGKREDAIWQAVDSRLWAHALLLASTLDRKIWKQVVQEFVRQEVKTIGNNAESLCALYEILGGNLEESVDQLVPPSARAGLQMVSKAESTGPVRNALEGLDRWRETLCLVLNNRSTEDQRALMTLARLLADYGRIEAAHICYLFARIALPTLFGGLDDPNASIVLLGADHRHHPLSFHHDTESIMLTEVYEFAMSILASGSTGAQMPHLAVYKLQRANELAETGIKAEAQAYCDAIASGLKSSTKHSLYYHPILLGDVEDLSNRLKQAPLQNQSWMAKPSIEKVSGSVWNKFSSFVTGEDSDAESKGSARDAAEGVPFANVAGSPELSRNSSQTDLYGSYPTSAPLVAQTAAGSRYAPNGMHSTRSSSELPRARPSLDSQRSPPSTSHSNEPRSFYTPAIQAQNQYSPMGTPRVSQTIQASPEPPMPPVAEESVYAFHTEGLAESHLPNTYNATSYQPDFSATVANGVYDTHPPMQTSAQPEVEQRTSDEPITATFEPTQSTYGGYEPPEDTGYVPYVPEPESDAEDSKPKPKKKSAIDDDDDANFTSFSPSVNNNHSSSGFENTTSTSGDDVGGDRRKANDEAAEAAFRAAAEADAKRASEEAANKKASGSWLGGWFSGGKKPESLDASSRPSSADKKVHRVHLGESKMKLYYDKEKGKWINPDNPEASEKKAVAPPPRSGAGTPGSAMGGPPMAGPPRSTSSLQNRVDDGHTSRTGTPVSHIVDDGSDGAGSRPGSSSVNFAATLSPSINQSLGLSAAAPPGSSAGPPTAGPPSRPASALSNVSGLDDLLGPSTGPRKVSGRAAKGKKGRYVDVMAK